MNIDTIPDGIHFRFVCTQCQQEKLGSSPTLITAIWPDGQEADGQPRWEYQEHNACTSCKLAIEKHNAVYEPQVEAQQAARVAAIPKPEWSIQRDGEVPKNTEPPKQPSARTNPSLPQQQAIATDVLSQLATMMSKQMEVLQEISSKLDKPKNVRKKTTTTNIESVAQAAI